MTRRATGTFDVSLAPGPATEDGIGRITIDKRFHGDLEATSVGEMLSVGTANDQHSYQFDYTLPEAT